VERIGTCEIYADIRETKSGAAMNITRREPLGVAGWEPFREMEHFVRQFSPFWGRSQGYEREGADVWRPLANITETDREYLVKAELPEVRKEDIDVSVSDGVLTLRGERKYEKKEGEGDDLLVESFYGTFSRSFSLPENVDTTKIAAECKDGVLRVHIPKTAERKSKPVSIQVK
jgi:HSP20 family protein